MEQTSKSKAKKIVSIVANVLVWIFVAFSLFVTILVFSAQKSRDNVPSLFGKSLIAIQSESMTGTFNKGDLVFMDKITGHGAYDLKVDDIITFRAPVDINGDGDATNDLNTHRIVSIDTENMKFVTKGDANPVNDNYTVSFDSVIGVCRGGKIAGLGNVISFLRSSLGFFLCVVLPLLLFFLFELYNFISILVSSRVKKNTAKLSKESEEEIKRKAIEEYLKQQQLAQQTVTETAENVPSAEPVSENSDNSDILSENNKSDN